jgi:hypothetical protein
VLEVSEISLKASSEAFNDFIKGLKALLVKIFIVLCKSFAGDLASS